MIYNGILVILSSSKQRERQEAIYGCDKKKYTNSWGKDRTKNEVIGK